FQLSIKHTCDVAAWLRETLDVTTFNGVVIDSDDDDRNELACTDNCLQRDFRTVCDHQFRWRAQSARLSLQMVREDHLFVDSQSPDSALPRIRLPSSGTRKFCRARPSMGRLGSDLGNRYRQTYRRPLPAG